MSDDNTSNAVPQINVDNAQNVTTSGDLSAHPAVIYIVCLVTVGVLFGFGWVTYAVLNSNTGVTAETKGAIIQTWNNLAVAAAAVWTSNSLINKLKGNRT